MKKLETLVGKTQNQYRTLQKNYRGLIRKRAIQEATSRLNKEGLEVEDFSQEEFAQVVREEEIKLNAKLGMGVKVAGVLTGLNFLGL